MQEKNKGWSTVKEDERYVVTDNNLLKNLVASATYLNPDKSTSGHKHPWSRRGLCLYDRNWKNGN